MQIDNLLKLNLSQLYLWSLFINLDHTIDTTVHGSYVNDHLNDGLWKVI